MAIFAYIARDESGKQVNGTLDAASVPEAGQKLRAEGKYPTSIKETWGGGGEDEGSSKRPRGVAPQSGWFHFGGNNGIKISRAEVIQISTQLAIMLETGVTLMDALDCLATQCENAQARRLLDDLSTQVQGGADFSVALTRHPR